MGGGGKKSLVRRILILVKCGVHYSPFSSSSFPFRAVFPLLICSGENRRMKNGSRFFCCCDWISFVVFFNDPTISKLENLFIFLDARRFPKFKYALWKNDFARLRKKRRKRVEKNLQLSSNIQHRSARRCCCDKMQWKTIMQFTHPL